VLRLLIESVEVDIEGASEWMSVKVRWAGGHQTEERLRRPVAKIGQLSHHKELLMCIRELRREGYTAGQTADALNKREWRKPHGEVYNERDVRALIERHGLTSVPRGQRRPPPSNDRSEWWLKDLAKELRMSRMTLYTWVRRGWVRSRRLETAQAGGRWVVIANDAELRRLRKLRAASQPGETAKRPSRSSRRS
jgi:transposase